MPQNPPAALRATRIRPGGAIWLLAAAALLFVVAGCSTPTPTRNGLSEALVDSGVPKPVAECTADAFTESLTPDQLQELAERGSGGAPVDDPKVTDDSADKLNQAMTKCQELLNETRATSTVPVDDGAGSTTTVPDGASDSVPVDDAEINPSSTP